jgi:hypothetical protein
MVMVLRNSKLMEIIISGTMIEKGGTLLTKDHKNTVISSYTTKTLSPGATLEAGNKYT